eukprot:Pgem_evm1s11082
MMYKLTSVINILIIAFTYTTACRFDEDCRNWEFCLASSGRCEPKEPKSLACELTFETRNNYVDFDDGSKGNIERCKMSCKCDSECLAFAINDNGECELWDTSRVITSPFSNSRCIKILPRDKLLPKSEQCCRAQYAHRGIR